MTKSRFKELCQGGKALLYLARLYNEEESLYKVGITSRENSYDRFLEMPYDFEILVEVSFMDSDFIFNLETYLISLEPKYKPNIYFGGQSECISDITKILQYLKSLAWVPGLEFQQGEKRHQYKGSYQSTLRTYVLTLLELEQKEVASVEELEKVKAEVEADPRFEALVEYINIFGVDRSLLDLSNSSLQPNVLKAKITKHYEAKVVKDILQTRYKEGQTILKSDLKQEIKRITDSYNLTSKFKIVDISVAFKCKETGIRVNGKKENAIKLLEKL